MEKTYKINDIQAQLYMMEQKRPSPKRKEQSNLLQRFFNKQTESIDPFTTEEIEQIQQRQSITLDYVFDNAEKKLAEATDNREKARVINKTYRAFDIVGRDEKAGNSMQRMVQLYATTFEESVNKIHQKLSKENNWNTAQEAKEELEFAINIAKGYQTGRNEEENVAVEQQIKTATRAVYLKPIRQGLSSIQRNIASAKTLATDMGEDVDNIFQDLETLLATYTN